ncbi:PRTase-like protein [Panus rudis PR-1116 ss-1]|nr:PRTase-like protein [Panus rudis PR-1116 ss-1]
MSGEPEHLHLTYNDIHKLIEKSAKEIAKSFQPDVFIAIGKEIGFFPARVLRTFLKNPATKRNIPIHAIGLSLYESLPGTTAEQIGNQVIRTQWLGPESNNILLGKRVLIVDEVDDSRKTLHYAVSELQKDVEKAIAALPEGEREAAKTQFGVFVVHNKLKEKLASLPSNVPYFAGAEVADLWLDYPWEASDIDEHDRLAAEEKAAGKHK